MTKSEFTDHLTKNPFEGHEKPSPPIKPKPKQMGFQIYRRKRVTYRQAQQFLKQVSRHAQILAVDLREAGGE